MTDLAAHIQSLIEDGEKFTYANFSEKSSYGYPKAFSPAWIVWIQRATTLTKTLSKDSTAAGSIRLGLNTGLLGNEEYEFQKSSFANIKWTSCGSHSC